jgi:chromosomal replication initiator protein
MKSMNASSVFETILRNRIGSEEYELWFADLQSDVAADRVILTLPSTVYTEYVRDHYFGFLEEAAQAATGSPVTVTLKAPTTAEEPDKAISPRPQQLNPRYTFSSFVEGPSNQFARAAAQSVAANPGRAYNPLFLYGGSGLGKTHLLHAIGHEILEHETQLRVLYVNAEVFVNELIASIRLHRTAEFREAYRSTDVLLLDDIQFMGGKERSQEEFFHTFNTLHEAGRQIVMTSDTAPSTIQGLEERLRTRFVWGLVADIQPPGFETKCAILHTKARLEGFELPNDVVHFIARLAKESIRELEGLLNRVIVYCTLTAVSPTLDTVRAALNTLLPPDRHVTPSEIIRFVAHHYGIKVADIKGRDNRRSIAFPRQVAIYLIREILELSYPEIGRIFSKHHSTIIYSVEAIAKERLSNPSLDSTLTTFVENFR